MIVEELKSQAAAWAAGLSSLYSLFSRAFRYPVVPLHQQMITGEFIENVRIALTLAGGPASHLGGLQAGEIPSFTDLEQRYMELFEIGGPDGPPCVVYEGEFGGGRLKVMEDVLRFYDHFGLQPSEEAGRRDRPDHLATEFEFMHFLSFQEANLLEQGGDSLAFQTGQREFLRFHLLDFADAVAARAAPRRVAPYSALCQLALAVCRRHLETPPV